MADILSNFPLSIRKVNRPLNGDGKQSRVAEYFGMNVLICERCKKRLSSQDLETMSKVMKLGGKIDTALAERVASAAERMGNGKEQHIIVIGFSHRLSNCRKA